MRKSEILSLRWKDVDFVKGFIHVADSKSGKSRDIPMNELVFNLLHDMKSAVLEADRKYPSGESDVVFLNPATGKNIQDVKIGFKAACHRAEIKDANFHTLRHTAGSMMVEAGVDLVTVSKILGHASIQMTMRYAHPTPGNMRLAVQKLGEYFEKS